MAIQPIALGAVASDPTQLFNGFAQGTQLRLAKNADARQQQQAGFLADNQQYAVAQRKAQILANGLQAIDGAPAEQKQQLFDRYKQVASQLDPENAKGIMSSTIDQLPLYKQALTQHLDELDQFKLDQAKQLAPIELQKAQQGLVSGDLANQGAVLDLDTKRRTNAYWADPNGTGAAPAAGDYFSTVRKVESGGNDAARVTAPGQTASGRYQFTDPTWKNVVNSPEGRAAGLTLDGKNDPNQQDAGVRILTASNGKALEAAGIPLTGKTAYLAHFLGSAGAIKLLTADPNGSAAAALPDAARANPGIFYEGSGANRRARTVSEVAQRQTAQFSGDPVDAATPAGNAPVTAPAADGGAAPGGLPVNTPAVQDLIAKARRAQQAGDTATAQIYADQARQVISAGSKSADGAGGLTPEDLDYAAKQYRQTGNMPALGARSTEARTAILHRAAEMAAGGDDIGLRQDTAAKRKAVLALAGTSAGTAGGMVRSLSTAIDHLGTLNTLIDALDNGDTRILNQVGNEFARQTGGTAVTNFETAKQIVADEIVKAIAGSGGGVADRQQAAQQINSTSSTAQLKGVVQTYTALLAGQLDGVHQQYDALGLGDKLEAQLTPVARQALGLPDKAAPQGVPAPGTVLKYDAQGNPVQ